MGLCSCPPSLSPQTHTRPRFLIASVCAGIVHIILGITIAVMEISVWNGWYSTFMFVTAMSNFANLYAAWLDKRKCGDIMGLLTCLHYGHFWSSLLLLNSAYSGGMYPLRSGCTTTTFLLASILMTWLTFWHKKIICPREESDPSHINNQEYPTSFKWFKYTLGPMASFVYGMAESRFGTGVVPAPHSSESLVGICTACLMFALYYRKYRQSAWGSVVSIVWSSILLIMMLLSFVLYGVKGSSDHMQYGISMLVCIIYFSFFLTAFLFKFCLLHEPLHLNFSAPPEANKVHPCRTSSLAQPDGGVGGASSSRNIDPHPFGMSRSEAEATARKLGFSDPDYLVRTSTQVTDSSDKGSPV